MYIHIPFRSISVCFTVLLHIFIKKQLHVIIILNLWRLLKENLYLCNTPDFEFGALQAWLLDPNDISAVIHCSLMLSDHATSPHWHSLCIKSPQLSKWKAVITAGRMQPYPEVCKMTGCNHQTQRSVPWTASFDGSSVLSFRALFSGVIHVIDAFSSSFVQTSSQLN